MGKEKSRIIFRRGFSLVELIVYLVVFGVFSTGVYTAFNRVSKGQKKAALSATIQNTQNLAMQNFAKTDKLKASLTQALGSTQMLALENCFNSLGTNCDSNFGTLEIPLTLQSSDPLASDVAGAFSDKLNKCTDPATCKKSFEQQVTAKILCPNDVSCSQVKLNIVAETITNPDTTLASQNIELNVPAINFTNSGLKGLCATNDGYITSINIGNNTLECAPANSSLNAAPLNNDCGSARFENGRILAGLADSEISNSSHCQTVSIPNWANSATGFPSNGNLLPSTQKIIPLNAPRISKQAIEGDIILILDDSKSMTTARAAVAKGVRGLVEKVKSKQGSLKIEAYTTDSFTPLRTSLPPHNAIPEAGVKAITTTTGSGVNQVDTTTYSLNDPFINITLDSSTPDAGANIESSILNFPYAQHEETESAACSMMRYILEENKKPRTELQRKKIFLMFSDELDAYSDNQTPIAGSAPAYFGESCKSRHVIPYKNITYYNVTNKIDLLLGQKKADEEAQYKELPYAEADTKRIDYMAVVLSMDFKYKKTEAGESDKFDWARFYAIIDIRDYGIDPLNSNFSPQTCPDQISADAKKNFQKTAEQFVWAMTPRGYNDVKYKLSLEEDFKCEYTLMSGMFAGQTKRLRDFSSKEKFIEFRKDDSSTHRFTFGNTPIIPTNIFKSGSYDFNVDLHRSTAETFNHFIPKEVHYYKENGNSWSYVSTYKPTGPSETYTEFTELGPLKDNPSINVAEDLSDHFGFPTPNKPQGSSYGKKVSELIKASLENTYNDMFAFVGFVHTKDATTGCSGIRSQKNNLFLDLASELPAKSANIVDLCEFNKYETAFDNIEKQLSTSDVDYSYEVSLDSETIAIIKLYLESHDVSELPVQVSLLLNPDSTNAPDVISLNRGLDFTFEALNINSAQPKFMIHFSNNTQMNEHLSNFKHIKVNIGQ